MTTIPLQAVDFRLMGDEAAVEAAEAYLKAQLGSSVIITGHRQSRSAGSIRAYGTLLVPPQPTAQDRAEEWLWGELRQRLGLAEVDELRQLYERVQEGGGP